MVGHRCIAGSGRGVTALTVVCAAIGAGFGGEARLRFGRRVLARRESLPRIQWRRSCRTGPQGYGVAISWRGPFRRQELLDVRDFFADRLRRDLVAGSGHLFIRKLAVEVADGGGKLFVGRRGLGVTFGGKLQPRLVQAGQGVVKLRGVRPIVSAIRSLPGDDRSRQAIEARAIDLRMFESPRPTRRRRPMPGGLRSRRSCDPG